MTALGCLIPIILITAGGFAGEAMGGKHQAVIGALAGAVVGVISMIALACAHDQISRHRL